MIVYMTGMTRCKTMYNADDNINHFNKPAVVRKIDGFYEVTRLQSHPVQPGQAPFKLRDGEVIFNRERL